MKMCLQCQAQYIVVKGQRHRCEYAKCRACDDWVSIHDHKCYIQPVVEEEKESEEDGEGSMEMPRPLFVDKGGKSDLQCLRIHLKCSRLGCPQFSQHKRHLGRIGQSTGPLLHAGHGYA